MFIFSNSQVPTSDPVSSPISTQQVPTNPVSVSPCADYNTASSTFPAEYDQMIAINNQTHNILLEKDVDFTSGSNFDPQQVELIMDDLLNSSDLSILQKIYSPNDQVNWNRLQKSRYVFGFPGGKQRLSNEN